MHSFSLGASMAVARPDEDERRGSDREKKKKKKKSVSDGTSIYRACVHEKERTKSGPVSCLKEPDSHVLKK